MNTGMRAITLVALCAAAGVLLLVKQVHGAPTPPTAPWWCQITISNDKRLELAESTIEEMSQVERFATKVLNATPALKARGYCDMVHFPRSPFAGFDDAGLLQAADAFWDLAVLQFAYRSLLGQRILEGTNDSRLEMFGILLDHSYVATERILRAGQCSCGEDNCTVAYPTTETWNSVTRLVDQASRPYCCTQKRFLGSIIARVSETVVKVKRTIGELYVGDREEMGSVWYMCDVSKMIPEDSCA